MASKNGSKPQVKRREVWVSLPDEYEGFEFKLWVNAPTKLWMQLGSGNEERSSAAIQKLVLDHNGWLDFDGNAYPEVAEQAFWEEIPTELAACMLAAAQVEIQKLPNSLMPRRGRSQRG